MDTGICTIGCRRTDGDRIKDTDENSNADGAGNGAQRIKQRRAVGGMPFINAADTPSNERHHQATDGDIENAIQRRGG